MTPSSPWGALSPQVPIEHIEQLRNQLKDDGELVLETLVIDGGVNDVLVPTDRYGKMRNVWFIPPARPSSCGSSAADLPMCGLSTRI